jgi:hypothetical protein
MRIVSLGLGAWLADQTEVQTVYYLGGAFLFLAGMVGLALFRKWPFEPPGKPSMTSGP